LAQAVRLKEKTEQEMTAQLHQANTTVELLTTAEVCIISSFMQFSHSYCVKKLVKSFLSHWVSDTDP